MNKRLTIVLFGLGVALQVTGFFADRVESFPRLLELLAPRYSRAQEGLEKLRQSGRLSRKDEGFPDVQFLLMQYVERDNPQLFKTGNYRISDFYITGDVVLGTLFIDKGYSSVNFRMATGLTNELKGSDLAWRDDLLRTSAETLKSNPLLVLGSCLFGAGLLLEILAFYIEHKKDEDKSPSLHPA